jgi:hypothetical protein
MAKTYPDQLAEWLKHQPKTYRERNLVAYLGVVDDVRAALKANYTIKSIWLHLHESKRIDFGYDTFLNYVHRSESTPTRKQKALLKKANETTRQEQNGQARPAASPVANTITPTQMPAGFTYNPIPNKEDLI